MEECRNFELPEKLVKVCEKRCKYCKKRVLESKDCANCGANYHPSCATRVGIANSDGEFSCCESIEKSVVSSQNQGKSSEKAENSAEIDEKAVKAVTRVGIASSNGEFSCCESIEKSVVSSQNQRKSSEKAENSAEIDEKAVKAVIREQFQRFFNPVQNKIDKKLEKLGAAVQYDSSQKQRKSRERAENLPEMDERAVKAVIRESFQRFFNPVENKIDKKLEDLGAAVQYMSNSFDDQKTRFESLLEEIRGLRKENVDLKHRVQTLETKVEEMEVNERACNIIVAGVPKQSDPSPRRIVDKIVGAMKVQVNDQDILDCFRLKNVEDGPILVKFKDVQTKKDILRTIKQMKGTTVKKSGLEGADRKVYLNEDLPISKRVLFKKTRDIKRKKGYKAAFCANGVIYLKKTDQEPPIKIRTEADLCG